MKEYHKIETLLDRDERFKVIPGKWRIPEFDYLKDNEWEFTEKVDGTNVRVIWADGKLSFGGKTDNAQIPIYLLNKLQSMFTIEMMQSVFPDGNACLYGEGYGAKIQKGGGNYKPDGCDFVLFDVKVAEWWLNRDAVQDVARKLNIAIVPIVAHGTLQQAIEMAQQGIKSTWGDFQAEGLVLRPRTQLFTRKGERIIGKIKTKDF